MQLYGALGVNGSTGIFIVSNSLGAAGNVG